MNALDACLNIEDLRCLASRRLPSPVFAFLEGGAEDGATMERNRRAFAESALVPRAMQDVSKGDPSTILFGQKVGWPFIVGPTGMPGLMDISGEAALARAAHETGVPFVVSTMASQSLEEVAAGAEGPLFFQLYLFRDREITRELIQRARDAGYAAIVLTIDVQVPANRERDRRAGMTLPPRFGMRSLFEFARHPRWVWDQLVRKPMTLANFKGARASPGMPLLQYINEQFDPCIGWKDVDWVASQWGGSTGIKGIMRPTDAVLAAEHGIGTIVLSNHGGRQLDAAASPMDVLEETVRQLEGRAEVIVDGGVRRGTDIIKALALGASGAMAGRVGLYGLGAGGEAGARKAVRILHDEYVRDLALIGVAKTADIDRSYVVRPASSEPRFNSTITRY